jgi:hypothetical protein
MQRWPTCVKHNEQAVRQSGNFWHWLWVTFLAVAITASIWPFATWHLSRTGFWYDESMQFWMALGLDGFGAPLTPRGALSDILKENAIANLDPGGFSLILGLWMTFSTNEIWQRALPLLFFATGMVGLGILAWTWRRSILFAVTAALVPAAYPLLLDYSVEVRAYSMEFAGVVMGCLMLARLLEQPRIPSALIAGTVLGFFMTARYSYTLFAAAACIALALAWRKRQSRFALLAAFTAPLVVSGALILFLTFLPQYQARISYQGGALIAYLRPATSSGKSLGQLATMAATNLLQPAGFPLTLLALSGLIAFIPSSSRDRTGIGSIPLVTASFGVLALAVLVLTALVWPWHPWDIAQKWSLWLHALSTVAVVRLSASLLEYVGPPGSSGWETKRWVTALALFGFLALDLRFASYRRPEGNSIQPALRYLEGAALTPSAVAVDPAWYPTVRYLYEYGSFAGSRRYPASFRLPNWDGPEPLVSPPQTHYLLTYLSLADAQAAFPQATIVDDLTLPPQLFRIKPAEEIPAPESHND